MNMIDINKLKVGDQINDFLSSYCSSYDSYYGPYPSDCMRFCRVILNSHTVVHIDNDYIILSPFYSESVLLLLNPR